MNEKIIEFIDTQKIATVCCLDNNSPYCFNCFYAYDCMNHLLYFRSAIDTHHGQVLLHTTQIAGTILPLSLDTQAIKGIQFQGTVLPGDDPLCKDAVTVYFQKYQYARTIPGIIFTIKLESIKMTDHTMGFGKKLLWERNEKHVLNMSIS